MSFIPPAVCAAALVKGIVEWDDPERHLQALAVCSDANLEMRLESAAAEFRVVERFALALSGWRVTNTGMAWYYRSLERLSRGGAHNWRAADVGSP